MRHLTYMTRANQILRIDKLTTRGAEWLSSSQWRYHTLKKCSWCCFKLFGVMVFKLEVAKKFQGGGVRDGTLSNALVMSNNCYLETLSFFRELLYKRANCISPKCNLCFIFRDHPCWRENFSSPVRFLFPRWGVSYAGIIKVRGISKSWRITFVKKFR